MSDVISRQAAISAICNACGKIDCDKMDKCEKLQLPPANCSEFPNSSDTISRQAAIDGKICIQRANGVEIYDDYVVPVEYLEQLPPAQLGANLAEVGTDCISRQAAIKDAESWVAVDEYEKHLQKKVVEWLKELPPAQPERIKGHWVESNGLNILMKKFIEKGETWRVCDKCGAGFMIGYQYECDKLYHETFHNFCPKCGAEMEVTE